MSKFDDQYLDLCERVLIYGERVSNNPEVLKKKTSKSTGTNMPNHYAQTVNPITTIRLPHQVLEFDLEEEFPILTTKFVGFKSAVLELLWIYQAQSNDVRWLHERGVHIWDEWEIPEDGKYMGKDFKKLYKDAGIKEDPAHSIGTAYGWIVKRYQLIESLIETLKNDPNNRRMVMSLWQNEFLNTAALPSCVWNSEWNITNGRLNVLVNSRSTDIPLGLPFNIAQYAVLCYLIAQVVNVRPGKMTFVSNDAHIYENQLDGIREQLRRRDEIVRREGRTIPAPKLWINKDIKDFFKFDNSKELKDIQLIEYKHMGKISMPVTA
ncbi:thymidylate synthase [Candidatus Saccharibacteria bacterium]|nr:thymidylate synthase [Candidatus Saccharibacteria bacterium]MBQ3353027.1 thymidylate synthase [Candidatus Saccharibacteria bacterium]